MALLQRYHLDLSTEGSAPTVDHVYGLLLRLLGPALERQPGATKPLSLVSEPDGGFAIGALSAPIVAALDQLAQLPPMQVPLGSGTGTLQSVRPLDPTPLPYQALFAAEAPPGRLTFRFLTPVCIKQGREEFLFPDPVTVFGALLQRHNAHSPYPFPPDMAGDFRHLRITQYRLQTRSVPFLTHRVTGFVGQATYRLPPDLPPQVAYLATALARFAVYSGVGARTHLGLGHALLQEER
ncbi:MAG TPA: CRISPR system precrRNA processing endoribonuclease RAMP protein Cas6 [Symbiobacteriaceae bacterium]|nr:CRISPR system precrRNA processing endoribonuclease RAMP protein Cas6 [Symbiobacteriaceae bacterium]